jgi:hypothetical protein
VSKARGTEDPDGDELFKELVRPPVGQPQRLEHAQAASIETQTIAYWRAQGWPQIDVAPKDGRTETTSSEHLAETLAWLAVRMSDRISIS